MLVSIFYFLFLFLMSCQNLHDIFMVFSGRGTTSSQQLLPTRSAASPNALKIIPKSSSIDVAEMKSLSKRLVKLFNMPFRK